MKPMENNKKINPIYYKSAGEMDKPMSELIGELRSEISNIRGKLHDIKFSYGWEEWIQNYEGGFNCGYYQTGHMPRCKEQCDSCKPYEPTPPNKL